ncbi:MAG: thiamine pyrophosphate-binding protein [Planctomycetia bacterium]|nr:thiamine pyrophosphate-binding protein [Planctomycetia bacterium]
MTAAFGLVHRLAQHGVRHVFGYPGGQLTPIYDSLIDYPEIRHFLTRHEQAAAFMADGYARASGRLGVCLAVCGPGVYNAATALATSHTDSIPVLCVSGQVSTKAAGLRSGYYHENEQAAACRHFTKAVYRAERADQVIPLLDSAIQTATTGRSGPVLFEVPVDVLRSPGETVPDHLPSVEVPIAPDVTQAVARIRCWSRPIILVGGGAIGAEDQVAALASGLGAVVYHTANGKSVYPDAEGMPWDRVTSDLSDMGPYLSVAFDQADGVLAVGCRFTQLATGSWRLAMPELIQIDIDQTEIGRHYQPVIGLVGDAAKTIAAMASYFPKPRPIWYSSSKPSEWLLGGMDISTVLNDTLPADAIVAADVTRSAYILMSRLRLRGRRSWLHPAGSVAMGYALPAALGAKTASGQRPVVAVVGDGGFQMSALEMATAVQEKLPIIIILFNDSCLTLIKATQERHYPGRTTAVKLNNPDFGRMAGAFGFEYSEVDTEEKIRRAVTNALASGRPALIEVTLRE